MGYELLIGVAGGMMIGTAIPLFLTVRRIVEMERCMEGLIHELLSERRIPMGDENDPFGETAASKRIDLLKGASGS